jgi:flagellar biogenesis protein FliO
MTRLVRPGAKGIKVAVGALVLAVLLAGVASADRTRDEKPDAPGQEEEPAPGWKGLKDAEPTVPVERMVVILVVLLGGGAVLFWGLKRLGGARLGAAANADGQTMKVLGRLPLGGRRGLVLVRAAGRLLVLGVSEAGIQKVLDRPDDGRNDEEGFAGTLAEAATLERTSPGEDR